MKIFEYAPFVGNRLGAKVENFDSCPKVHDEDETFGKTEAKTKRPLGLVYSFSISFFKPSYFHLHFFSKYFGHPELKQGAILDEIQGSNSKEGLSKLNI